MQVKLERAVKRAMENAGTMPAKDAVKLLPKDWKAICDLALADPRPGAGDASGVDFPMGAIENGRAFADRLETTGLECPAGDLRMCSDWQEFRRCFDHLAQWALALSASPAAASGPSYVVNCCNCGRIVDTREKDEGGDGFGAELSDGRWTCSPECWDAVVEPGSLATPTSSPAGGVREADDALAKGCCSAASPCLHQKQDPHTICEACQKAGIRANPGRDNAARAIARVDGIELDWITDQTNPRWTKYRAKADAALAALSAPASEPARRMPIDDDEIKQRILGALDDYRDQGPDEGESWESWYSAAFDLASEKIADLLDQLASEPVASAPEQPDYARQSELVRDFVNREIDAAFATESARGEAVADESRLQAALDYLAENKSRSLAFDGKTFCEDDNSDLWIVTEVQGGMNDREWVLLGSGSTPAEALLDALPIARPSAPAPADGEIKDIIDDLRAADDHLASHGVKLIGTLHAGVRDTLRAATAIFERIRIATPPADRSEPAAEMGPGVLKAVTEARASLERDQWCAGTTLDHNTVRVLVAALTPEAPGAQEETL